MVCLLLYYQGERRGSYNALFLHCRSCDSLTVVVVAHFDSYLAGCHLAAIGRADDFFSRFHFGHVVMCTGNKTNDLILNFTPENKTQHSTIE